MQNTPLMLVYDNFCPLATHHFQEGEVHLDFLGNFIHSPRPRRNVAFSMTFSSLFSFSPHMDLLSRLYSENGSDKNPGMPKKRETPTVKENETLLNHRRSSLHASALLRFF